MDGMDGRVPEGGQSDGPGGAAGPFELEYDGQGWVLTRYTGPDGAVVLPDKVTEIGAFAFNQRFGITEVALPSGLTRIGQGAFRGCARLKSLDLPDGVVEIGAAAFHCCASLAGITLPAGLREIGWGAFQGCLELKTIALPGGLERLGAHLFGPWYPVRVTGLVPLMLGRCAVHHTTLEDLLEFRWTGEDDYFEVAAAYLSSGRKSVMERAGALLCVHGDWAAEVMGDLLANYGTARRFDKAARLIRAGAPELWPAVAEDYYALARSAGRRKAMRRLEALKKE